MVGTEDRILNRWAQFAKKYSFLPLIGGGSTKYVLNLSFASGAKILMVKF
jgi:hypothetical protein